MRILVVYAHPDDESFGPAAVLAKYAREGAKVYGLIATRGEHGSTDLQPRPSPRELARLRERDLREAAAIIGFTRLDILSYEDGTLEAVPMKELEEHILDAIRRYHPRVVLTFGPGGITRHPDHLAIHRAAVAAFCRALAEGLGVRELYYDAVPPERAREMGLEGVPDGQPNTFIDVSETLPVKIAALRLHGRHIVDAREMAERLEREPQTVATLYRAWPVVKPGERLTGFHFS
jgi:LmbE family N-acetylglucosaminyl deacetylase